MNSIPSTTAVKTLSAVYPVRFRADLPRAVADDYWIGPHGDLVVRGGHVYEYNQHHFSETDHGYWPATPTVGTYPDGAFRWDGMTEARLRTFPDMVRAGYGLLGTIFPDEQNVFDNVLGHVCGPGGSTWWTSGYDPAAGHRTVLFVRRRRGVSRRRFRAFVHHGLGQALHDAGALDVRAYTFLPLTGIAHRTPGVSHVHPPSHRHDGAIVFGLSDRDAFDDLVARPEVKAVVAAQADTLTAVHAYGVDRTVPVIRIPD